MTNVTKPLDRHTLFLIASRQYKALLAAGFGASALLAAGFSASAVIDPTTPVLIKPYTRMLAAIRAGERKHDQSTFGDQENPVEEVNICNTPICTAGHLVSLAGAAGWALKQKYGFPRAAAMIHAAAHPGVPCQNYDTMGEHGNELAMAYIEELADIESELP